MTAPTARISHGQLLLMLIGLLIVQSLLGDQTRFERILVNFSLFALIMSAIQSLSERKWRVRISRLLGGVALAVSMLTEVVDQIILVDLVYISYTIILVLLLVSLAESVFSLEPSNRDRIFGSISIYMVMGLIWAFLYSLLELNIPDSFNLEREKNAGIHSGLVSDMFFFSSVTITTLGYGDIIPLSKPARMLAAMEAMAGQLYIAVVIAHIVGMRISEAVQANDDKLPRDSESRQNHDD